MEDRKNEFVILSVILLAFGFLNYIRKIVNGYKLDRTGKILYLVTMIIFVLGSMVFMYLTNLNNILSFLIGLTVSVLSEHIAKLFLVIGNHFNDIVIKVVKAKLDIDLTNELKDDNKKIEN